MYRSVLGKAQRASLRCRGSRWRRPHAGVIFPAGHGELPRRGFHLTPKSHAVKPFMLADIGEGITECQIMSWLVKPGDKVAQFDPICEVQSDKASVEITSRFDGTITKLHYDTDDIAIVGKPLLDIDMESTAEGDETVPPEEMIQPNGNGNQEDILETTEPQQREEAWLGLPESKDPPASSISGHELLSPAVRFQLKSLDIDPSSVPGTGKDGRILKADVQRYINEQSSKPSHTQPAHVPAVQGSDQPISLSPIEKQMFRTMTKSLAVPQFLYTHSMDLSSLEGIRQRANALAQAGKSNETSVKLTPLPFIMKAISQVFLRFPRLNAHLDAETDPKSPRLTARSSHNFGIAIDTPQGLVVPVVKNVQAHSVASLSAEIRRLSERAQGGRLEPSDFSDATFLVSNIGSIGGNVVSPVIVPPMVGIVGIGKAQAVPSFAADGSVVPRQEVTLSWSADHRVLDGATVAKCAEAVTEAIENMDVMVTELT